MSPDSGVAATAIRCEGLAKRFGSVVAVDGVDLEIPVGTCFGLLGPNGAGKTTTVEMIEGLTVPTAGSIEVFGERWGQGRDREIRERLGIQLQETRLAERLTVGETVRLFRSLYRRGRSVEEAIEIVQLKEKTRARVGTLSGGQRQRLALTCALVGDPQALFLDEPTTGLDPQARLSIWEVVERFKAGGGTVVLTTHYMEEAARLCDRVAIIDAGKVIAEDSPAALVASLGAAQIVELVADRPLDEARLQALPGVTGHHRRGGAHVLTVDALATCLPALLAELDRAGAKAERLTTHEPTLEDVFVQRTGRGLRDA